MDNCTENAAPDARRRRREIRREWSCWGRYVATARKSKSSLHAISAIQYRNDYQALREMCAAGASRAGPEDARLYREMVAIMEPWGELHTLQVVDAALLPNLESRIVGIQWRLRGRSIRRRMPWLKWVALAMASGLAGGGVLIASGGDFVSGPAGRSMFASMADTIHRYWYRATIAVQGAEPLEITVGLVTIAVLVGLFTAMRTRSY